MEIGIISILRNAEQTCYSFHDELDSMTMTKGKPLRFLVAEDDRINQLLIKKILEKAGWEATVVENGEKAVASFQAAEWDVLLMDINMPVMGGLEAIRRIREIEKEKGMPRVPIISLTANALAEDRKTCIDAGADDYIAKPLNIQALKGIIASLRAGSSSGKKARDAAN